MAGHRDLRVVLNEGCAHTRTDGAAPSQGSEREREKEREREREKMASLKNWEAQARTNSILAGSIQALEARVDDCYVLLDW